MCLTTIHVDTQMHHSFALSRRLLRRNYLFSVRQTLAGLTTMPSILIELHNGQLGPIELQSPPEKTAAKVLDACSRKFRRGVGSLSPKGKPNLLLEDNDVVVGGMTYVFTPSAGSPGMHYIYFLMSQADSQAIMQILWQPQLCVCTAVVQSLSFI